MALKLPPIHYKIPNMITGFGLDQRNLDTINQLNIMPSAVLAFETPERFLGNGTYDTTGVRKTWSDTTARDGQGMRSYLVIARDDEGAAIKVPAPGPSPTDPQLAKISPHYSQQQITIYRTYGTQLQHIPILVATEMPAAEAFRVSFSTLGISPQVPVTLPDERQWPWVMFFAETVGMPETGEVYVCDYQQFAAANKSWGDGGTGTPGTGPKPKTDVEIAAALDAVKQIMAQQMPKRMKFDSIVKAVS